MEVLGEIIIGGISGLFVSIFWMVLPWAPYLLAEELKKDWAKGDYLGIVFSLPNILIASLPFLFVYAVYDHRGIFCAVAFAAGLFWSQLLIIWAWFTTKNET